jgi:hypothetical protein
VGHKNLPEYVLAFSTSLGALGAFLTLVVNLKQGKRNGEKIEAVHEEVNSTATAQVKRVEQLSQALQDEGVSIPKTPAVVDSPPHPSTKGPGT